MVIARELNPRYASFIGTIVIEKPWECNWDVDWTKKEGVVKSVFDLTTPASAYSYIETLSASPRNKSAVTDLRLNIFLYSFTLIFILCLRTSIGSSNG